MRMMLKVSIPVASGNRAITDGTLPKTILGFVEAHKPEACYFVAEQGQRTGYFFFDMKDASAIPPTAEPFFLNLDAGVEMKPAMNLDDLKAGLQRLAKRP